MSESVASVVEEVEYMQAVTKRDEQLQKSGRGQRKRFKVDSAGGGAVVFLASLLLFFWFTMQLEGITPDTVFLSIYCSIVLAFSIESLLVGILR